MNMERLLEILSTMKVPSMRVGRRDWRWINRNLAVQNKNHPDFPEAIKLVREAIRREMD